MGGFIFFIILALLIFGLLRWLTKEESYEKHDSYGYIDKVFYTDDRCVWYTVVFHIDGTVFYGTSGYYSTATPSLESGDKVDIKYYYISSNKIRVDIISDKIIPVEASKKNVIIGLYVAICISILFSLLCLLNFFLSTGV